MGLSGSTLQTPAIQAEGLTKSFGAYPALRGVDLEVEPGESIAIFGPNGAGKTTLIKVLATIMNPSSGRVMIDGLNVRDNAGEIRHRIGVVTHQTFLYSNLTGYENLEFYSRMYDVTGHEKRIHELAALVGMTSRLHERVGMLSRGMQQRLAIARSLLHAPTLMLLDEPETGLDQQVISIFWKILQTEGKGQRTVIITTHNLERGLELCDRLLILDKGKFVYQSPSQALDLAGLNQAYQQSTGGRA